MLSVNCDVYKWWKLCTNFYLNSFNLAIFIIVMVKHFRKNDQFSTIIYHLLQFLKCPLYGNATITIIFAISFPQSQITCFFMFSDCSPVEQITRFLSWAADSSPQPVYLCKTRFCEVKLEKMSGAPSQVPIGAADPKIKEIMTSLDDDKIGELLVKSKGLYWGLFLIYLRVYILLNVSNAWKHQKVYFYAKRCVFSRDIGGVPK